MKDVPGLFELTFRDPQQIGATPPLGFIPFAEGELGDGDCFGVYWPYGRELSAPVVCNFGHAGGTLRHAFSSVAVFLDWLEANGGRWGQIEVEDHHDVSGRFLRARMALAYQKPHDAVGLLQGIAEDFPEHAEVWFTLAGQQRRLGEVDAAVTSTIRAFVSNWAFGLPPERVLLNLRKLRGEVDDPVVEYSDQLDLRFGGTKTNDTYRALDRIADAYFARDQYVEGLLLRQNYAWMMQHETYSFKERYGFEMDAWYREQTELCERHLGDGRMSIDS